MTEALWTRTGQPPMAYVRYRLRMMYHCLPSELELEGQNSQHLFEMLRDLRCAGIEARVVNARARLG